MAQAQTRQASLSNNNNCEPFRMPIQLSEARENSSFRFI